MIMTEYIGPALPPDFKPHTSSDSEAESSQQSQLVSGLALPPGFKLPGSDPEPESRPRIGPALPPGFRPLPDSGTSDSSQSSSSDNEDNESQRPRGGVIGPVLPAGVRLQANESEIDDDDDDIIGPQPFTGSADEHVSSAAREFERRAEKMKNKLLNKDQDDGPKQREEWMTSLPSKKLGMGMNLSARTFKARSGGQEDDDGSAWTETPADRARREQELLEGKHPKRKHDEIKATSARDKLLQAQVEEYNMKKHRQESLLEMHEKKIGLRKEKKEKKKDKKKGKKKKEKEKKKKKGKEKEKMKEKKPERRAFDREVDMKVNKFDEAMRKQFIQRTQNLAGKFGHGAQQFI